MIKKKIQPNALLIAACYLVLGILLAFFPRTTTSVVCNVLAAALTVLGVVSIFGFFKNWSAEDTSNDLAMGILAILLAVFLFLKSEMVLMIIPLILGFAILISGALKAQIAVRMIKMKQPQKIWLVPLIASVICLVIGEMAIQNPFASVMILMTVIGAGLIFCGLVDLAMLVLKPRKAKENVSA